MSDPQGMITRLHFYGYKPCDDPNQPPPMHVTSMNPAACHWPAPRPLEAGGDPGPALVYGGSGLPSLGIDPTDPTTWGSRGYRQCSGMIGRFNVESDWRGNPYQLNPLGMGS